MLASKSFTVTQPTEIHFGVGAVKRLGEVVRAQGGSKALLVIDPGLGRAGMTETLTAPLEQAGVAYVVHDHVDPEPGLRLADEAAGIARRQDCDCVIGAGGGSAMDVAKAVSILLTNGGRAIDYLGLGKIGKPGVPKIMVPTSAGTGAEVTFTAVFINEETGSKGGMNGNPLYPEAAVLDPALTVSLPPHVTAATGLDALTHALESYTSVQAHPISEMYSMRAIELVAANLRTAFANGADMEARSAMLLASLLGGKGLAMAGVGLVHAMAYPLGGMFGIPHGLANAVLLPYVVEYNLIGNVWKHAVLAGLLGCATKGFDRRLAAELAVAELHRLNKDLGIPASLAELGIDEDRVEEMADVALKVAVPVRNNPRRPTRDEVIAVYRSCFAAER